MPTTRFAQWRRRGPAGQRRLPRGWLSRRALPVSGVTAPWPVQLPQPPRELSEPRWAALSTALAAPPGWPDLNLKARPVPLLDANVPTLKLKEKWKIADD